MVEEAGLLISQVWGGGDAAPTAARAGTPPLRLRGGRRRSASDDGGTIARPQFDHPARRDVSPLLAPPPPLYTYTYTYTYTSNLHLICRGPSPENPFLIPRVSL